MNSFSLNCGRTMAALLTTTSLGLAHITYGGRDLGTLETGGDAVTIDTQTVSSSFGWADASDADWGDSHRGRFFRFTLTETTTVSITVERNNLGTGAADTFLPAFSLYAGLAQLSPNQPGHDSAELSINSRPDGTEGSFRALADWSVGNDPTYNTAGDPLSGVAIDPILASFSYIGNFADGTVSNYGDVDGINGDGLADGYITGMFADLLPGDYSLFIGGADYAAQLIETGHTYPTYGINVTVQAVPEPSTYAALLGLAGLGCALTRRRRPASTR